MVRILTIGLLILSSLSAFTQQTARDTIVVDKKHPLSDWFTESKYALFLHWGLYSQYSNQWKGKTLYGIGEWIMYLAQADIKEYEAAAQLFNPVGFNATEWVQIAKNAGMKYIVFTAKHHEGFAMFNSFHPFNITSATPFKRDPLKELAAACEKEGIGLGFYYSQFQDWHEINNWSKDLPKQSFAAYFKNKCIPQVKELLTNYGPISLIWFDTPGEMTKEQSLELVKLVKQYQPRALINSRIGNGVGDYETYGDHEIPVKNVQGLWEAINTSNDSWGFAWYDENWKTADVMARDLISVIARGGNYMLNIGPKADGTLPKFNVDQILTVGKWIRQYPDAIYGAKASPWLQAFPWGDVTVTKNNLNLFVFDWKPGASIYLTGIGNKIKSVVTKGTNEQLKYSFNKGVLKIELPVRTSKQLLECIRVELDGEPRVQASMAIDPNYPTTLSAAFATPEGAAFNKLSWMEKFGEWKHRAVINKWKLQDGAASWEVNFLEPGYYQVEVDYHACKDSDGTEFDLFNNASDTLRLYLTATTGAKEADGDRPRFRRTKVGIIKVAAPGLTKISLIRRNAAQKGDIHIASIQLNKTNY